MKTIYRTSVFLVGFLLTIPVFSTTIVPPGIIPIHVVFSARAYWDGPSKSCLPREKGGCCHIWIEGMVPGPGEIFGDLVLERGNIFQLTVSRGKGMDKETQLKYFSDGTFNLEGIITFDPAVLSKLGISGNYVVPASKYPVSANGDMLTITFK